MCDGKTSISRIAKKIGEQLNQRITDEFVLLAIDQLKKENLLANGDKIESNFDRLTRREVVRRAGLASMVALPIVSSIVAPASAHAQSCVGAGPNIAPGNLASINCTSNSTCASAFQVFCCPGMATFTADSLGCGFGPIVGYSVCD